MRCALSLAGAGQRARFPMRVLQALHACAALVLLNGASAESLGVEPSLQLEEQVHEYAVHATDARGLRSALDRPRPQSAESDGAHALTKVVVNIRMQVEAVASGCRRHGPALQLQLQTWLPEWVEYAAADVALQRQWAQVRRGLEVHEAGHRDLAIQAAQEFIAAVRALDLDGFARQPCSKIERRVSALHQRMLLRLQIRQLRYDERTGFGAQQGASLVLEQPVVCARRRSGISRACPAEAWPTCGCPPAARSLRRDP